MKMKQYSKMIGIILGILTSVLNFGTIPVCFGAEYTFSPEETMYLAGVEMAAYKEGVRYSLYDIDKDDISELFIIDENCSPAKLKIYRYDPGEDGARMICDLDDVAEVYRADDENSLFTADSSPQNDSYKE